MVKSVRIRNGVVVPSKAWVDWLDDVLGSEDTGTVLFIPDGEKLEGAVEEALQYLSDLAGLADDTQASAGIKMIVNGARERIAAARAELAMQQPARQVEGDPRVEAAEHLRTVSRSGRCSRCLSLADALEAQMAEETVVEYGVLALCVGRRKDGSPYYASPGHYAIRRVPDKPTPEVRPWRLQADKHLCPVCYRYVWPSISPYSCECGARLDYVNARDLPEGG